MKEFREVIEDFERDLEANKALEPDKHKPECQPERICSCRPFKQYTIQEMFAVVERIKELEEQIRSMPRDRRPATCGISTAHHTGSLRRCFTPWR